MNRGNTKENHMRLGKRDKKNTVYLNRPIQSKEQDWIGISTYVEKLNDAIEAGAKIIAVTSDFGTGKSSLISLYKNLYETPFRSFVSGRGKKVLGINMWGNYEHIQDEKSMPLELHKAFIYQVISQINPRDKRKSNYISRRLSKDFGIFSVNGKNSWWSIAAISSLIGFFLSAIAYKFQKYIQTFFELSETSFSLAVILLFIVSVCGFGFVIANSEIIFSSKKSEGNRTFDENVLIDLFKQEVLNHCGRQHYIIVIEDLDRIDEKDHVLQFLRELRRYYLTEGGRHKITFIVCIKPEAMLRNIAEKEVQEYKKIFDYTINLQKINIDNFDAILKGLLEEKKEWLEKLNLKPQLDTPGMEWMIHGCNIDIREIKNRLNEALTLYESLLDRFPENENKAVITFEKCAVATYLRREYENDFYKLEDNALDVLVSQYAIRGLETIEGDQQPDKWKELQEKFKEDVVQLIKSKQIDANYRLYFYNYPSDSKLFTISEMRVYNSIVYQETPKDKNEYLEHLNQTSEGIIEAAYQKISTLGVRMPLFVLDYDKLFVLLYMKAGDKFFELIESQRFDENNEERICNLIENCVQRRQGEYEWETLIHELAQRLNKLVEDKTVLCAIRQRMCLAIPEKVRVFKNLFMEDNPFITSEEVDAIGDGETILDVVNYEALEQDTESVGIIQNKILKTEKWNPMYIEFYQCVIACQGMDKWKETLAETCAHFGEIPEEIVDLYAKEIKNNTITVSEYVACLENVANLGKTQFQILSDYQWTKGLSKRLCQYMYQVGFYLEYLCNITLLEQATIPWEDENIYEVIASNIAWIQANSVKSFYAIRKLVLNNHSQKRKYDFIFETPYPVLSQSELLLVEDIEDVLRLLEGRKLTREQAFYVVNHFNQKYRNPTQAFKIIQFILQQEEEIANEMFYKLNLSHIPYARMASIRKKEINDKIYELFQMRENPDERVKFLHFTGVPVEEMEKDLWEELNQDEDLRKTYLAYANCLEKIPNYTLRNIMKLDSVGIYSAVINQRLWESKDYETYVSSKTALEKHFEMEEDKMSELWSVYTKMFHAPNRRRTRDYMINNKVFMKRLIEQKEYLKVGDNIVFYTAAEQSEDLLNYVVESYDVNIQKEYFSKIKGFDGYEAAHRFCEIAKENNVIGRTSAVYQNVKGKLINPGLEGWLTRIWRGKK